MVEGFSFEIVYQSRRSAARVGRIHTPHGVIDTPNFVAVATNGTLKGVDNQVLNAMDLPLVFCNTYHLAVHPGADVVAEAGGLHRFIGRQKPIITDSGGFQVFSLAYGSVADELKSRGTKSLQNQIAKIDHDGVWFRSYRDGALMRFTPEISVAYQKQLAADIIIPFDELPPYHCSDEALAASFARTHEWEKRSLLAHQKDPRQQVMYSVIHGGVDHQLRRQSAEILSALDFFGHAIGGSLGKNKTELFDVLAATVPHLPDHSPRHLLGIADQQALLPAIAYGMDTFDSCYPMRSARHGALFMAQRDEILKITHSRYRSQHIPVTDYCQCHTCQHYTRSYLHHLFKAKEPTALQLASIHNLQAMVDRFAYYRQQILDDAL